MRIALLAPLEESIPPKKYGGIESVVSSLADTLVERGHKVTLFATGDAKTSAQLVFTAKKHLRGDRYGWQEYNYPLLEIAKVIERADDFDIIHSHVDEFALFFSRFTSTPMVSTTHNPFDRRNKRRPPSRLVVYDYFYPHPLISISKSQRRAAKIKGNFIGTVYNGVDTSFFKFNPNPKNHFVWISRFGHHKGPVEAIKAAKLAGVKLKMAARIERSDKKFFNQFIKSRLIPRQIYYVGELLSSGKQKFFAEAKALLYPIDWEEPFGLVLVEAMATGTPVIAFDRGSVREIVDDGKTGFVVKSMREMVKAIKNIDQIKREDCRARVEKLFSAEKMVTSYEKIYYEIIKKKKK